MSLDLKEFNFLNGKPITSKQFPLRSLFYGEGVFETFRYNRQLPLHIKQHLERLRTGAKLLNIPCPSPSELISYIQQSISRTEIDDAYVKLCLLATGDTLFYKNPSDFSVLITIKNFQQSKEEFSLCISTHKRNPNSVLNTVKTLNYLEKILVRREAIDKGFDDALILNLNNELTETSSSNIFWVRGKDIYTPSKQCGLLAGITRDLTLEIAKELGYKINERRFGPSYIMNSDFAFLTNSLSGTIYVNKINNINMPPPNDYYFEIKNEVLTKLGWNT